jgi:hypothetical protein
MAEHPVEAEFVFRPSDFQVPITGMESDYHGDTVTARTVTTPAAQRLRFLREASEMETPQRTQAVCTVQTFRNNQTGKELNLIRVEAKSLLGAFRAHAILVHGVLSHNGMEVGDRMLPQSGCCNLCCTYSGIGLLYMIALGFIVSS